jgi:peptidyl-prolyl cis-trans isomerase A (cyclophilin A)
LLDDGGARSPEGLGFAAFGSIVGGMDVVRKIQASPTPPSTAATRFVAQRQSL